MVNITSMEKKVISKVLPTIRNFATKNHGAVYSGESEVTVRIKRDSILTIQVLTVKSQERWALEITGIATSGREIFRSKIAIPDEPSNFDLTLLQSELERI